MFNSILCSFDGSVKSFFNQLASALGYNGILIIALAVELFFVLLYTLRSAFSYEIRIRRSIDKVNNWLFINKNLTSQNVKEFNDLIKRGPKRFIYYWQQYILFREKGPTEYMSVDNLIEKPLRTSSFASNIKSLSVLTVIWSLVTFLFSCAYQSTISPSAINMQALVSVLFLPLIIMIIGYFAGYLLKMRKTANLDDIYHIYHIFARFVTNACVTLPPFIDYDLLFSPKEIERGNPQLREYYEARARKAKEEFEQAQKSDIEYVEYDFNDAGVDGSLVLERAMRESEAFINKKTSILAKISHVDAEKEALKRNYENVQKDLQRKIQASKENIVKLIQRQEATTNRMEVGFLRKQQEQEINKQEALQAEYDQEETRFALSNEELTQEIAALQNQLQDSKEAVQKAMVAEYQTFYEKIMKFAYDNAENRVANEKKQIINDKNKIDQELIAVQTQVKRLIDENETLRYRLAQFDPESAKVAEGQAAPEGHYDDFGNYIYSDGSYHDPNGLFHDVDGKIYDMNGNLISENANIKEMLDNGEAKVEDYIPENENSVEPQTENPPAAVEEKLAAVAEGQAKEELSETNKEEKPKAKRGRPRKYTVDATPKVSRPRGRPRKDDSQRLAEIREEQIAVGIVEEDKSETKPEAKKSPTKKIPATKKTATAAKKATTAKKPAAKKTPEKKSPANKATTSKKTTKRASTSKTKPRSVVKKTPVRKKEEVSTSNSDLVSLAKINKLITDEEAKLSKMKAMVNDEISDAISGKEREEIDVEREELMKTIEALKSRAEDVKADGDQSELTLINKRLEDLIGQIAELNKKSGN